MSDYDLWIRSGVHKRLWRNTSRPSLPFGQARDTSLCPGCFKSCLKRQGVIPANKGGGHKRGRTVGNIFQRASGRKCWEVSPSPVYCNFRVIVPKTLRFEFQVNNQFRTKQYPLLKESNSCLNELEQPFSTSMSSWRNTSVYFRNINGFEFQITCKASELVV